MKFGERNFRTKHSYGVVRKFCLACFGDWGLRGESELAYASQAGGWFEHWGWVHLEVFF